MAHLMYRGYQGDTEEHYSTIIDTMSEKTREEHILSKNVIIDSTIKITFKNMWNGTSGLMYAVTHDVLPLYHFQIPTLFAVHYEEYDDQFIMRAPSQFGIRFGIGKKMEVNLSASLIFSDSDFVPFYGGLSLKYHLFETKGDFRIASTLYSKATYHSGTGADTLSKYTGLTLGIPFQLIGGPVSLIINPEIIVSPFAVTYTPDYDENIGLNIWAYGRAGLLFDFGSIITGISCAVRKTSFIYEDFDILYPILGAYEFHFMVPDSYTFVSAIAASEYESEDNYYVMAGIGLGFIY